MVEANASARQLFLGGNDLAAGPLNMLDWFLQPQVRDLIVNWEEALWSGVHRLRRDVDESGGDAQLVALLKRAKKVAVDIQPPPPETLDSPVFCTQLRVPVNGGPPQTLSVVSTIARFGTTREITLDELRIELIFPADAPTRAFFESP